MIDLDAIEARANAAAPAPWRCDADGYVHVGGARGGLWYNNLGDEANGLFVAHARQDVPELVAEVRRLREAIQDAITTYWQDDPVVPILEAALEETP